MTTEMDETSPTCRQKWMLDVSLGLAWPVVVVPFFTSLCYLPIRLIVPITNKSAQMEINNEFFFFKQHNVAKG